MVHFAIVYSKVVFVDKETSGPVLMLQFRPRPKKENFCCQKRKQEGEKNSWWCACQLRAFLISSIKVVTESLRVGS